MTRTDRAMVLGAYGTFGRRITAQLLRAGVAVLAVGRRAEALASLQTSMQVEMTAGAASFQGLVADVHRDLETLLEQHRPALVVHTCGPFQGQSTAVAQTCLAHGVHCIDLSDDREYVQAILALDAPAREAGVALVTGASTVPALSSAVVQHFLQRGFAHFSEVRIGITPGQRTERGLATARGVLSYLGKRLPDWPGQGRPRHGWMSTYVQKYPCIGRRLMGACNVPDLDLFAAHFPMDRLLFSAGMESGLLHGLMWLTAWGVRLKLPIHPARHAELLLRAARWFDRLGSGDGGMHVCMRGRDADGEALEVTWFIEALDFDGPMIPAVPAALLARKALTAGALPVGAMACVGLLTLDEYLQALEHLNIHTTVHVHTGQLQN